ncbi:MAG: addiction module toxin, HicA family [SAR202 cluster bacterium Io17-Chloro-G4]|nr:MAG: addiction module toxin, HicA family [SAR202 cluster bacterium Io17-Chloro-G4]
MRRRRLLAYLRSHNCTLIREGSRHSWWGNAENDRRSAVPRHTETHDLLARKICRDFGIPPPP